ncbi:hypothetical protein [Mastigocladopsis repens]|uniref:hypothetical protein n=1 Tax=Mastigocladopsis repens TaxID=221287 RepID=UPI001E3C5483|nr:hypothetical protein [Mastigocladopsis repens]
MDSCVRCGEPGYAGGFPDLGDWCKSCGQATPTPSGVPQAYPEGGSPECANCRTDGHR